MWGYLSEFWDAITGVVVEAGNYTADFFHSIGNAVAGAIGGAFDWLLHYIWDGLIFLRWILETFAQLFTFITSPLSYFYNFLRAFFTNIVKPPIEVSSGIIQYATSTNAIFSTIPQWDTLTLILGVGVLIAGAGGLLFLFLKIH